MPTISRREALQFGAGLTLSLLAVEESSATPAEADAEIAKFTGGQSAESGKIAIDLPDIAENGNTVPLSIKVDSPMNAGDYVSDILILTDGNPYPGVAKFQLTPMSGRAEAATRIRLNTTENVIVVAKTSAGKIFADRRLVKVTVGGCGG
jgi:sulfur-oxidizing protein SoxY